MTPARITHVRRPNLPNQFRRAVVNKLFSLARAEALRSHLLENSIY